MLGAVCRFNSTQGDINMLTFYDIEVMGDYLDDACDADWEPP
ncbi:hypothetical protein Dxin01_00133 [Deinococcus xinjiangensis]|uniref:Uncharacterized protein n=1 Tax=Deinococcus xinjiangensis TaxID=457454 RepID=A0ABP9V547_9DEIO